jgi:hypothetical protein
MANVKFFPRKKWKLSTKGKEEMGKSVADGGRNGKGPTSRYIHFAMASMNAPSWLQAKPSIVGFFFNA